MHFVAFLRIVDEALNREQRPAHLAYIAEQFREGRVMAAGPFADGWGGMVIYRAGSRQEAEGLCRADPAVSSGARTYELREWTPLSFTTG